MEFLIFSSLQQPSHPVRKFESSVGGCPAAHKVGKAGPIGGLQCLWGSMSAPGSFQAPACQHEVWRMPTDQGSGLSGEHHIAPSFPSSWQQETNMGREEERS